MLSATFHVSRIDDVLRFPPKVLLSMRASSSCLPMFAAQKPLLPSKRMMMMLDDVMMIDGVHK